MGRLVDADKLIEALTIKTVSEDAHIISIANAVVNLINNQPTAYDVDAVVAELKNESDYEPIDYDYYDMPCTDEQYFIATDTAIDIVKRGGVE